MELIQIFTISTICVICIVNYLRFRSVLYPAVLQSGIWLIVLSIFSLYSDYFIPVSGEMYFVLLNGVVTFSIGTFLATWNLKYEPSLVISHVPTARGLIYSEIIFWLACLGLPFVLFIAYKMGYSGATDNLYVNIRYSLNHDEDSTGYGILAYLVPVSYVSVILQLLIYKRKWKLTVAIATALIYAIAATARTNFFLLGIIILGIQLITKRISLLKAVQFFLIFGLILFTIMGLALNKLGAQEGTILENFKEIADIFIIYLTASIPAFDQYSQLEQDYGLGLNVFRIVFILLSKVGFDVSAPELIRDFQYVPMGTNVYTVYQPYFADFSWVGVVVIQFILGFWHGILFRKTSRGNALYAVIYALSLYPLFMQFFQDQYFSLLSMWIQYGLLLFLYFIINKNQRGDRVVWT